MDIYRFSEKLMAMDDQAWARHGNPWSGLTRIAGSIPLFFAVFSYHWIGWWSLVPIVIMLAWIFINPRLFPPPKTADHWMTRGVLGERVFLNRERLPIPDEHALFGKLTTAASALFFLIAVYGFWAGLFWTAFSGFFASVLAKIWFVDRMAWLWDDMKDSDPVYQAWSQADWAARPNDDR